MGSLLSKFCSGVQLLRLSWRKELQCMALVDKQGSRQHASVSTLATAVLAEAPPQALLLPELRYWHVARCFVR